MPKEELAKLEQKVQRSLQLKVKSAKTPSGFKVDMDEVKRLAKKLNEFDAQKHATPDR